MATYKWDSPLDWLMDQARTLDEAGVRGVLVDIIPLLDSDAVQDLFQSEMDSDGYFDDLDAVNEDEDDDE